MTSMPPRAADCFAGMVVGKAQETVCSVVAAHGAAFALLLGDIALHQGLRTRIQIDELHPHPTLFGAAGAARYQLITHFQHQWNHAVFAQVQFAIIVDGADVKTGDAALSTNDSPPRLMSYTCKVMAAPPW